MQSVKERVAARTGLPPSTFFLMRGQVELEEAQSIGHYSLIPGSRLLLQLRVCGGTGGRNKKKHSARANKACPGVAAPPSLSEVC